MFGQSSSTPFGGFGQQPQQQNTFGQSSGGFGAPSPFGGGQQQSTFGQPAAGGFGTSTGGGFGTSTSASPFGGGAATGTGGFGQTQQPNQPFGSTTAFGSPAPAPSGGLFGSTTSSFGGGSTFGGSTTGGSLFGSSAPTPATGGLFGPTNTTNTSPFGGGATSTFGSTPGASTFGGGFGTGSTTTAFGAAAPSTGGSLFGSTPSAPFGSPPGQQQQTTSLFGAPSPAPAGGGLFGAPASTTPGIGGQPGGPGTRNTPFQPTSQQDGTNQIILHSISAMPQFSDYLFEELRVQDYAQGNRGTSTPTASNTTGAFGFGAPAPTTGLFNAPAPTFGGASSFGAPAPSTGLFGSTTPSTTTGFGGGGLFGNTTPAPAPFGAAPAQTTGLFGNPAPAPATGGFFGASNPAPAPGFGGFGASNPAPAPSFGGFGTPAPSSGLFGSTPASAPAFGASSTGGGLFGASSPAPAPFGAPSPGTSLFGNPAPAPTQGLFGSPAPAQVGFGFASNQPAPAPSLFSAPATGSSGFGFPNAPQPASGVGLFGQAPAGGQSLFGGGMQQQQQQQQQQQMMQPQQQQMQQQQMGLANAHIIPPVYSAVLEQQLKALETQKKELEKSQVWAGGGTPGSSGKSPTTPTNLSDSGLVLPGSVGVGLGHLTASSPRSAAKIRPRGFPKTEPTRKNGNKTVAGLLGRDNSGIRTPEDHVRSSATRLVIRPDSLKKPLRLQFGGSTTASPQQQPTSSTVAALPASTTATTASSVPSAASPSQPAETLTSPPMERTPVADQFEDNNAPGSSGSDLPTTSPGFEYYQRVIGSGLENSGRRSLGPSTPSSSSTQNGNKKYVPKLTRPDYTIVPAMEELVRMSEADLAAVPGLAITRSGYGRVEWIGAVDVRGADLDTIVNIQTKDISVYAIEEEKGTKPPLGSKLNRPARLTFYGVFPLASSGAVASQDDVDKMKKKLEKNARKVNAKFISYDPQVGEWIIEVPHFSRYTVDLDDDSSDDEDGNVVGVEDSDTGPTKRVRVKSPQTPMQMNEPKGPLFRKATPFKQSRVTLSDEEDEDDASDNMDYKEDEDDEDSDGNVIMTETAIMQNVTARAEMAYEEVFGSIHGQPPEFTTNQKKIKPRVTFEDEGEDELDDPLTHVQPPANFIVGEEEALTLPSITEKLLNNAKVSRSCPFDMGLRMRNSFRVGFLPNGSFLKLDGNSTRLERYRPQFSDDVSMEIPRKMLLTKLNHSRLIPVPGSDCSLIKLQSKSLEDSLNELASDSDQNEDAAAAFLLLAALLPNNDEAQSDTIVDPSSRDILTQKDLRDVEAVTRLLTTICSADVTRDINAAKRQNDPQAAVFAALSGGNIEKACELAADAGLHGLATLLSTGLDCKKDILRQVLLWVDSRDITSVSRNMKSVGGDSHCEDEVFRRGHSSLDWRRRLSLRLLQQPDRTLEQVVNQYESSLADGSVAWPYPRYISKSTSLKVKSGLYTLLYSSADPQSVGISQVLDPRGFTSSVNDYSFSFHLSFCLSAMDKLSGLDDFTREYLLNAYESQLVSCGMYEWAVFVALCLFGNISKECSSAKIARAKELIMRNFDESDPMSLPGREFLEVKVGVPSAWFEEALSARSLNGGDIVKGALHASNYNKAAALCLLESLYLPAAFFLPKDQVKRMLKAWQPLTDLYSGESLFGAVSQLLMLEDEIMAKTLSIGVSEAQDTLDQVERVLAESKLNQTSFLVPIALKKSVPLNEMVSQAHDLAQRLKMHLQALAEEHLAWE